MNLSKRALSLGDNVKEGREEAVGRRVLLLVVVAEDEFLVFLEGESEDAC